MRVKLDQLCQEWEASVQKMKVAIGSGRVPIVAEHLHTKWFPLFTSFLLEHGKIKPEPAISASESISSTSWPSSSIYTGANAQSTSGSIDPIPSLETLPKVNSTFTNRRTV